ncbi:hypothetical protein VTG60DRAFT_4661 [Thermothelomyces hinnuleus]
MAIITNRATNVPKPSSQLSSWLGQPLHPLLPVRQPSALPGRHSTSRPRAATGQFIRRGDDEDGATDDDGDTDGDSDADSSRVAYDHPKDVNTSLVGTEFDPHTSTSIIKSGMLHPSPSAIIRPVQDCLARARYECRGNEEMLIRTCQWIRRFHMKATDNRFGTNAALRSLKVRLKTACKAYHATGVIPTGMPEPEELLAARICAPKGDANAQVDGYLYELGYLHYGPPAHRHVAQGTTTKAGDESNEEFARRRQLATEADVIKLVETLVKMQEAVAVKSEQDSKTASETLSRIEEEVEELQATSKAIKNENAATADWKKGMEEELKKLKEQVARLNDHILATTATTHRVAREHEGNARSSSPPPSTRRGAPPRSIAHPTRLPPPPTNGQENKKKRTLQEAPAQESSSRKEATSAAQNARTLPIRDDQHKASTITRPSAQSAFLQQLEPLKPLEPLEPTDTESE